MRPIPTDADFHLVLEDLMADQSVRLLPGGQLAHSWKCERKHLDATVLKITVPPRRFVVSLEYPELPDGDTGPIHPRARVGTGLMMSVAPGPEISRRTLPYHPHLSYDNKEDSWACPLSPHETDWTWKHGGTREYLDQVAIWIFKTEVWARTGGVLGGGLWVGTSVSHEPTDVLASVAPDSPCRCGSGTSYRRCHMPFDLRQLSETPFPRLRRPT